MQTEDVPKRRIRRGNRIQLTRKAVVVRINLKAIKEAHALILSNLKKSDPNHSLIISNYDFNLITLPTVKKQQLADVLSELKTNENQLQNCLFQFLNERIDNRFEIISTRLKNLKKRHLNLMIQLKEIASYHELVRTDYNFNDVQLPEINVQIMIKNLRENEAQYENYLLQFQIVSQKPQFSIIYNQLKTLKQEHNQILIQLKNLYPNYHQIVSDDKFYIELLPLKEFLEQNIHFQQTENEEQEIIIRKQNQRKSLDFTSKY